jgi:hypothetical protein
MSRSTCSPASVAVRGGSRRLIVTDANSARHCTPTGARFCQFSENRPSLIPLSRFRRIAGVDDDIRVDQDKRHGLLFCELRAGALKTTQTFVIEIFPSPSPARASRSRRS